MSLKRRQDPQWRPAGFHWSYIDAEHGPFDLETIQEICRAAVTAGLMPIVRVADLQYSLVARALDNGAQGIIFPRVEDPEILARAISWTQFPPKGVRGFGLDGFLRHNRNALSAPMELGFVSG